MIADHNFYDICFTFFYPRASATAYGQRPKFVRAEYSAMAESENCAYLRSNTDDIRDDPHQCTLPIG